MLQAANLIHDSKRIVAFTGAGISVESGIPDFRSGDGLWSKYNPVKYCSYDTFLSAPHNFWKLARHMHSMMENSRPNSAHVALADMECFGKLKQIITQNIDNLHQAAGSQSVLEIHGSWQHMICMACDNIENTTKRKLLESPVPLCPSCGGVLKMDIVMFGEPVTKVFQAQALASKADLMIVIGCSLTVAPANQLVECCRKRGGKIIIVDVNPENVKSADVGLVGKAGDILPKLVSTYRKLITRRPKRSLSILKRY